MTTINTRIDNITSFLKNFVDTATVSEWLEGLRAQYNDEVNEWEVRCQAMTNKMNEMADENKDLRATNANLVDNVNAARDSNEKYIKGFNIQSEELKKMSERLEASQNQADLAYQLGDFIQDWCNENDCEPEDIQSLAHEVIDDHLPELLDTLARQSPEDWGKLRDWSVDVRVTFTGTIGVRASTEEKAKEAAEEKFRDGDVDADDLSFDECEVEDVNED